MTEQLPAPPVICWLGEGRGLFHLARMHHAAPHGGDGARQWRGYTVVSILLIVIVVVILVVIATPHGTAGCHLRRLVTAVHTAFHAGSL